MYEHNRLLVSYYNGKSIALSLTKLAKIVNFNPMEILRNEKCETLRDPEMIFLEKKTFTKRQ